MCAKADLMDGSSPADLRLGMHVCGLAIRRQCIPAFRHEISLLASKPYRGMLHRLYQAARTLPGHQQ